MLCETLSCVCVTRAALARRARPCKAMCSTDARPCAHAAREAALDTGRVRQGRCSRYARGRTAPCMILTLTRAALALRVRPCVYIVLGRRSHSV